MKTMHYIRNLPIRRKVTLALLTPCIAVLLLACAVLVAFEIRTVRAGFERDIRSIAQIVGAHSTAAIAFNDSKAATELLNALAAKEYIESAILVLPNGSVFARYGDHSEPAQIRPREEFHFNGNHAVMIKPVVLEGKQIATLNLVCDYEKVYNDLVQLINLMLLILLIVGTGTAVLFSRWMQRLVSAPVLRLARTAQTIAEKNDYSVRAQEESGEELGALTHTFNRMLARIQEQDAAINVSQHKLEALINSIDGIVWECNPDTFQFTFVSRQCERILGFSANEWLADPRFWHEHLHPEDAARAIQTCHDFAAAGKPYCYEYRMVAADGSVVWIRESGSTLIEDGKPVAMRGIFLDITAQKQAAAEVARLNRSLLETSRFAGMAEVATGVLHNVGNVLNSVCVSTTVLGDRLRQSRVGNLGRAAAILQERRGNLTEFLVSDPKGKVLPDYLGAVSQQILDEHSEMLKEVQSLNQNLDHVKRIVAMQQSYAKVSGAYEQLNPISLLDDALQMNAAAFERHQIQVITEFANDLPAVNVDRHKVLQILTNILRNAKYALDATNSNTKKIVIRVAAGENDQVLIQVQDNGVGIAPENLSRIFQHGFTTRKEGHGFGLHSGANAAHEMGGRLVAQSEGLGHGALFTLELPVANGNKAREVALNNNGHRV